MDNRFPPNLIFKPNGIFYHMVSSFMAAVASSPAIFRNDNPMKFEPQQTIELTSIFYEGVSVYPHQIYMSALEGHLLQDHYRHSLGMMLANLAYESAKVQKLSTESPGWELLRHIRNASSHNNRFNFYSHKDEPRHPAYWRNLIIDHTKKGKNNPLYETACFGSFMEIAELLWLLKDIEDSLE